jgi:hypothetical protein
VFGRKGSSEIFLRLLRLLPPRVVCEDTISLKSKLKFLIPSIESTTSFRRASAIFSLTNRWTRLETISLGGTSKQKMRRECEPEIHEGPLIMLEAANLKLCFGRQAEYLRVPNSEAGP